VGLVEVLVEVLQCPAARPAALQFYFILFYYFIFDVKDAMAKLDNSPESRLLVSTTEKALIGL
jgi:hypothetical protein